MTSASQSLSFCIHLAVSMLTAHLISVCLCSWFTFLSLSRPLSVWPCSLPPACSLWHVFILWKHVSFSIPATTQTSRCGLWKKEWGKKVRIESCLNKCISSPTNIYWASARIDLLPHWPVHVLSGFVSSVFMRVAGNLWTRSWKCWGFTELWMRLSAPVWLLLSLGDF